MFGLSRVPRLTAIVTIALFALGSRAAIAHPMGNFAICHYARIMPEGNSVHLRYVLDFAEIPTVSEKETLDPNHDGIITTEEEKGYRAKRIPELLSGLSLALNGRPVVLKLDRCDIGLSLGAGGLQTLKLSMDLSSAAVGGNSAYTLDFHDRNFAERTGWKEIVAGPNAGVEIKNSNAATEDRSHELSIYPTSTAPPQMTEASMTVRFDGGSASGSIGLSRNQSGSMRASSSTNTPRDSFTQAIAHAQLTPMIMLLGLIAAFVAGAFHALSPGHGKAMVAAYLVGSKGTARHAVLLGTIVTLTHTAGVFALGFVTLFASQYIVPEQLYPWLSAISGLSVCGVGLWLFVTRLRGLAGGIEPHHHHEHDHDHPYDHIHSHTHDSDNEHNHTHDHAHLHSHDHSHEDEHAHGHSHGPGHHHHHMIEGPITAKALIALGISGGIVPCPSALIVLLAAINLHRIAYGMGLIAAFSLGLASVLVAIGIMVVYARGLLDRIPSGGTLLRRLPIASAAAVTVIGVMLVVQAFRQ